MHTLGICQANISVEHINTATAECRGICAIDEWSCNDTTAWSRKEKPRGHASYTLVPANPSTATATVPGGHGSKRRAYCATTPCLLPKCRRNNFVPCARASPASTNC